MLPTCLLLEVSFVCCVLQHRCSSRHRKLPCIIIFTHRAQQNLHDHATLIRVSWFRGTMLIITRAARVNVVVKSQRLLTSQMCSGSYCYELDDRGQRDAALVFFSGGDVEDLCEWTGIILGCRGVEVMRMRSRERDCRTRCLCAFKLFHFLVE